MKADDAPKARQLIEGILKYNKLQTMKEIYERIEGGPDGRIRTSLSPVGTETGRLSSSATFLEVSSNLQNIPKKVAKLDPLYDTRSVMVPEEGFTLIEIDLSQAEARATCAFANDEKTLALFESGADIHRITAAKIFGKKPEHVTWTERHLGKTARHALSYGMGWKKFMEGVNKDSDITGVAIAAPQARAIVEAYHRDNPALRKWWAAVEEQVRKLGFLVNPFGRKHTFIDMGDSAVNTWIAFLPQSTIADHLNDRLVVVERELDPEPFMVLLQIHDAILGQSKHEVALEAARRLKGIVETPLHINDRKLLIPSDVSWSRESWGKMEEVKL